ncbi:MAG: GAF and ANTAR domain-containing protein [Acidimicrobiales bacterium]
MAASATGMTGAGIMLMSDGGPRGSLCTTDEASDLIEQLQFTLGEGPCIDAYRQDRAVVEPDLAAPEVSRWPAFTGPAVESGVRAVFGFPIRVGAVRLGAVNLYRNRPGPLTAEQHADSLVTAEVLAEAILALQADAEMGQIARALEVDSDFHYLVHQASGMIAVQLGVSVEEALIRLRAYAFSSERTVADIAQAVVERLLRFDRSSGPGRSA